MSKRAVSQTKLHVIHDFSNICIATTGPVYCLHLVPPYDTGTGSGNNSLVKY